MAKHLNRWFRKEDKPTWLDRPNEQLQKFQVLKKGLIEPPALALPVENSIFLLETECLAYKIGGTLMQHQEDDNTTNWATIGYLSRSLTDIE